MHLIILLGLVSKLVLVSGYCGLGTTTPKNVDWNNFTGTWYWLYHTSNNLDDGLECVTSIFAFLPDNSGTIFTTAYKESEHARHAVNGTIINRKIDGYFEIINRDSNYGFWVGRYIVLAVDYERYCIIKFCSRHVETPHIYLAFRSQHPEEETVKEAFEELKKTKLNSQDLVSWSTNHC